MAFIPADKTARVSMHFSQNSQQVENVFYVENSVAWTPTTLLALGATVKDWWNADLKSSCHPSLSLNQIVVKDMTTDTAPEVVYATGLPLVGTGSGGALPNNVTIAIQLITGLGGRSFRGRQYILGLMDSSLTTDRQSLTSGAVTAYLTAYNGLISSIDGGITPGLVVASFFHGVDVNHKPIPRTTAVLTPVASAVFSNTVVDSQRRRLPGRGK